MYINRQKVLDRLNIESKKRCLLLSIEVFFILLMCGIYLFFTIKNHLLNKEVYYDSTLSIVLSVVAFFSVFIIMFIVDYIVEKIDNKAMINLFDDERKFGTIAMYAPRVIKQSGKKLYHSLENGEEYIEKEDDIYLLSFNVLENSNKEIQFSISEELFEEYKDKFETKDNNLFLIDSTNELFLGNYTITK